MQITDALQRQANQGKVIAYRFKGKRFDCGSIDGFVEATNFFYQQIHYRTLFKTGLAKYKKGDNVKGLH